MKKSKKLKWVTFDYDDETEGREEVLKIQTTNNTDDDCYLTKGEMRALAVFLAKIVFDTEKWWHKCQTT